MKLTTAPPKPNQNQYNLMLGRSLQKYRNITFELFFQERDVVVLLARRLHTITVSKHPSPQSTIQLNLQPILIIENNLSYK